jgi:hypothetical protein
MSNCWSGGPRIFIGSDVASGSARAHGGDVGTFNQLYPSGHGQFGNIDAIGRQNIIDVEPGLDLTLLEHENFVESLKLRTSFYEFWRQSDHDDVYTAAGTVLRAAGTSDHRYVGSESDERRYRGVLGLPSIGPAQATAAEVAS